MGTFISLAAWPIFSQQSFPTQVIINMEAEFMKKLGTSPPPTLTLLNAPYL